ncbi:MAG: hypothetical protein KDJ37_14795 [Hyphomicrobiaceae bacterium]|nr:hypothetical protein [Hyphomicrobiaceae bacterium]
MAPSSTRAQVLCLVAACLAVAGCGDAPSSATVPQLQAQLGGAHCRFTYESERCQSRGFNVIDLLVSSEDECDLWAVQCLGTIMSEQSTTVLIRVLDTKRDVETCDGVLPVRSQAVALLGLRADPRAIAPLERLLSSRPKMKLSPGAVGCEPRPEDAGVIEQALGQLRR